MYTNTHRSVIFVIFAAILSFSCNKGQQFQGSTLSKNQTRQLQESTESFTTKQAHSIVDFNLENREKREKKAERERKRTNEELKEANKSPKHLEPQPYNFY